MAPEATVAAGRAQRRAATRAAASTGSGCVGRAVGMLEPDGAPAQGATGGKWSRRSLPWKSTTRRPQGLRPRSPLDAIVNGTSGPQRRTQTRPATASAVPRHVLSRMYYWLCEAT
jgi:hypothetical protein